MPQFDSVPFLTQYFWLVVCFFTLYFLLEKYYLPSIGRTLRLRRTLKDSFGGSENFKVQAPKHSTTLFAYFSGLNTAFIKVLNNLSFNSVSKNNIESVNTQFSKVEANVYNKLVQQALSKSYLNQVLASKQVSSPFFLSRLSVWLQK